MSHFQDRLVLITGVGSGIGRELARQLLAQGARIAGIDRSEEGLAALVRESDGKAFTALADVTDLTAMQALGARIETELGAVDFLFACAGIGRKTAVEEFDAAEINAHIQINLIGVVNSVAAVIGGMMKRRRGHLVVLSSVASYRGLPFMGGYCASKAGVNALFDSFRLELMPMGVDSTIVCPAWIRTAMTKPLRLPARELMPVDRAVTIILEAVARRKSFVAFPAGIVWQARLLRYLPRSWSDWLLQRDIKRIRRLIQG